MAKQGSPEIELEQVFTLKSCPDVGTEALSRSYDLALPRRELSEWRAYLTTMLYSLGALLSVWGLFVSVGYYWPEMTDEQRCGVFGLSTLLSLAIAWRHGRLSVPGKVALGSASLLLGGLIFVADNAYHLADGYQLLVLWSSLVLPLAVAAEFAPLWLFVIGLLNVTVNAISAEFMPVWLQRHGPFLASLVFNLGLLTIWEIGTSRGHSWLGRRFFSPIISLIALTPITFTLGILLADPHYSLARLTVSLIALGVTWLVLSSYFTAMRRDPAVLATTLSSMVFICSGFLARHIFANEDPFNYLLFSALVVLQVTVALALLARLSRKSASEGSDNASAVPTTRRWLAQLATEELITSEQIESLEEFLAQRKPTASNWFAQTLSVVGASFSAVFLWLYLLGSGLLQVDNAVITGLGICILACAISWLKRSALNNVSLTLALCGQLTLAFALFLEKFQIPEFCLIMAGLQLAFVILYQEKLGRFLSVNFCGMFLWAWLPLEAPEPALDGMIILVSTLLSLFWLRQKSLVLGLLGRAHGPIASGLATLLVYLLVGTLASHSVPLVGLASGLGLTAITLATSRVLKANLLALLVLAAVGALTVPGPGIIASVLICLLAFSRRQLRLQILGIVSLLTYGIAYFNKLGFYELEKSAALLGAGLALLLIAKWADSLRGKK